MQGFWSLLTKGGEKIVLYSKYIFSRGELFLIFWLFLTLIYIYWEGIYKTEKKCNSLKEIADIKRRIK